jgi:elongator complex protein 3
VTADDRLAGFLRLSLPAREVEVEEIRRSAMIREVHVYGVLAGLGESADGKSQHAGLGTRLIERAVEIAHESGFASLAVISSVGTREYYRRLGFADGELYQRRPTLETGAP